MVCYVMIFIPPISKGPQGLKDRCFVLNWILQLVYSHVVHCVHSIFTGLCKTSVVHSPRWTTFDHDSKKFTVYAPFFMWSKINLLLSCVVSSISCKDTEIPSHKFENALFPPLLQHSQDGTTFSLFSVHLPCSGIHFAL